MGCIFTILVQSSSIFTSTLTPLVGLGIVSIERMYPFTLGSNIGTTITGIMAALTATTALELRNSLQIALCHTFFNIFGTLENCSTGLTSLFLSLAGILLWFPVPFMRNVPIAMAKKLGETTGEYRWFAVVYIVASFFVIPLVVFAVSLAGWYVFIGVFGPIVLIILVAVVVNLLQAHKPKYLPHGLRTWSWLPRPFRTLAWYDQYFFNSHKRLICCNRNGSKQSSLTISGKLEKTDGHVNENFDDSDRLSGLSTRL